MILLLAFVIGISAGPEVEPFALNASKLDWFPTLLSVGTWNVMLQPWFQKDWEKNVLQHLVGPDSPDVLALQEVWADEDVSKILNAPGRRHKYPYHYLPTARPDEKAGCDFSDQTLAYLANAYLECQLAANVPTNTLQQPLVEVPFQCLALGVGIGIQDNDPANQLCLACLINTLQYLPPNTPESNQAALATCAAGQGPKNGHKGKNGQLILSKYPITKVSETLFDGFLVNRLNIHATIKGIKFGFGHFAYNVLEDIQPELGVLMYGTLQKDHIQDFVDKGTEVVLADMNTGPNYQPEGFQHFADNGYFQASTTENTWCKQSHANFLPCPLAGGPPSLAIDHVMIKSGSNIHAFRAKQFNEYPVPMSDHVGVAVQLLSAKWSQKLTNAVEKMKKH